MQSIMHASRLLGMCLIGAGLALPACADSTYTCSCQCSCRSVHDGSTFQASYQEADASYDACSGACYCACATENGMDCDSSSGYLDATGVCTAND